MIIKEFYLERQDGVKLYRSYSDQNVYIKKIGTEELYIDAIDVEDSSYQYEETNFPIEDDTRE